MLLYFPDFFNTVVQNYKHVDIVVNNAGIMHEKEWRNCVDINLVNNSKAYKYIDTPNMSK